MRSDRVVRGKCPYPERNDPTGRGMVEVDRAAVLVHPLEQLPAEKPPNVTPWYAAIAASTLAARPPAHTGWRTTACLTLRRSIDGARPSALSDCDNIVLRDLSPDYYGGWVAVVIFSLHPEGGIEAGVTPRDLGTLILLRNVIALASREQKRWPFVAEVFSGITAAVFRFQSALSEVISGEAS